MEYRNFTVITRPFYREHPPSVVTVYAKDESHAMDRAFFNRSVKEIMFVCEEGEVTIDDALLNHYWDMYKN